MSVLCCAVSCPCYAVPFHVRVMLYRFMSVLCCTVSCPCYAVPFHVRVMLYRFMSVFCCTVLCPCYAVPFHVRVMLYRFMSVLCCIVFCPCYAVSFRIPVKHYPSLQANFPHFILISKDIVSEVFFLPMKVPLYTGVCITKCISRLLKFVIRNVGLKQIHISKSLLDLLQKSTTNQIFNKNYSVSIIGIIITLRPQQEVTRVVGIVMLLSSAVFPLNPLNVELNPICCLLALLGAHHFLHVSRMRVKSLILRLLMSYIYGAPILDVSRSHTMTQHSLDVSRSHTTTQHSQ